MQLIRKSALKTSDSKIDDASQQTKNIPWKGNILSGYFRMNKTQKLKISYLRETTSILFLRFVKEKK